jgi:hypothetical protein
MLMLTGYMDETGNTKDERQRFAGMAGLVAPLENWEKFEARWKRILGEFKIPYFHMKDFANFKGFHKGWHEQKRRKLFGKLMTCIAMAYPIPVGSICSSEDFRSLSAEHKKLLIDPYFLSFVHCVTVPSLWVENAPPGVKLAMVFGEHGEFQSRARRYYEEMRDTFVVGPRLHPPEFRDMRDLVPLQAADIVAYELYKEAERRRYRRTAEARYGYVELVKIADRMGGQGAFFLPAKADLIWHAEEMQGKHRDEDFASPLQLRSKSAPSIPGPSD